MFMLPPLVMKRHGTDRCICSHGIFRVRDFTNSSLLPRDQDKRRESCRLGEKPAGNGNLPKLRKKSKKGAEFQLFAARRVGVFNLFF
jgi:hypothetical protein